MFLFMILADFLMTIEIQSGLPLGIPVEPLVYIITARSCLVGFVTGVLTVKIKTTDSYTCLEIIEKYAALTILILATQKVN